MGFTREELEQATDILKLGKASGPNSIPYEAVKKLVKLAPSPTLKVLNIVLKTG